MRKKALSALLALCMVVALLPVSALAANQTEDECAAAGTGCAHEAAVGSTHYDTLEEAIEVAAAADPKADVTLLNRVLVESDLDGKDVTLIISPTTYNAGVYLGVRGNVTIKDLTVKVNSDNGGTSNYGIVVGTPDSTHLEVKLENVTVDASPYITNYAMFVYAANSTIELVNSNLSGSNTVTVVGNNNTIDLDATSSIVSKAVPIDGYTYSVSAIAVGNLDVTDAIITFMVEGEGEIKALASETPNSDTNDRVTLIDLSRCMRSAVEVSNDIDLEDEGSTCFADGYRTSSESGKKIYGYDMAVDILPNAEDGDTVCLDYDGYASTTFTVPDGVTFDLNGNSVGGIEPKEKGGSVTVTNSSDTPASIGDPNDGGIQIGAGETEIVALNDDGEPAVVGGTIEIGEDYDGGLGTAHDITCSSDINSFDNMYVVARIEVGSGESAEISLVMLPAAEKVTISYAGGSAGAEVEAWLVYGDELPDFSNINDLGFSSLDSDTVSVAADAA